MSGVGWIAQSSRGDLEHGRNACTTSQKHNMRERLKHNQILVQSKPSSKSHSKMNNVDSLQRATLKKQPGRSE